MREATKNWLRFARENLDVAVLCLTNELYNACLQNVQQCAEKAIKAVIIEQGVMPEKTHRIATLLCWIREHEAAKLSLSDADVDRLDAIYIPSKYPITSALPDAPPTQAVCAKYLELATQVLSDVVLQLGK